jgi:hypothetical protein
VTVKCHVLPDLLYQMFLLNTHALFSFRVFALMVADFFKHCNELLSSIKQKEIFMA